MNLESLIKSSADFLRMAMKQNKAPDKIISEVFREKKYFGSKDRKFISELVFSSIRNFTLYKYMSEQLSDNNKDLELKVTIINCAVSSNSEYWFAFNIIHLLNKVQSSKDELNNIISQFITNEGMFTSNDIKNFNDNLFSLLSNLINDANDHNSLSNLYSFPTWLMNRLSNNLDLKGILHNSLRPAPTFIRINNHLNNKELIIKYLENEGINYKFGNLSPAAIMIEDRVKLDDNELFKSGLYEIQDEGSQLISYALAPSQNSRILDACAGAGGKSLHIADITNDKSEIIATDTEFGRLKEISKRAARSGLKSITAKHIKNQDFDSLMKLYNFKPFDYVLVDAPCSGMGTIRRDPSRKFKVTESLISRLADKQYRILEQYSKFVKKGGILVYSTCSLLRDENENIVDKFLNKNINFEPDSLIHPLAEFGIEIPDLKPDDYRIAIAFDKYNNDGFFISRMKRVN